MGIPWPDENPDAWNTLKLGPVTLPGIADLEIDLEQALDIKKPKGSTGASVTANGVEPRKLTATLLMWKVDEDANPLDAWAAAYKVLWPTVHSGKAATAVDIVHPKAQLYGVRSVVIKDIKDKAQPRGDRYEITIVMVEWFPPAETGSSKVTKSSPIQNNTLDSAAKNTPTPPQAERVKRVSPTPPSKKSTAP